MDIEKERLLVGQFFESSPAVFSQFRCALLNPEPLCLKSPSACLSMAYTRLFKYWSGISHYSSTACKCSLPPFTLRRPVSALNDSLFPNSSWFMMSNPKIPSKTLFLLSCSRATSFRRCLPSFTLTGTRRVCLPDANGTDGGWRARRSLNHNVKKRRQKKERALSRLVAVLLTSSPTPLSCIYANGLRRKGTQRMTHCLKKKKKSMAQSLAVPFTNTISHSGCQEELSPRQRSVIKPQKKTSSTNLPDGRSPTLASCCNTPQRKLCKTHKEASGRVELYFLPIWFILL